MDGEERSGGDEHDGLTGREREERDQPAGQRPDEEERHGFEDEDDEDHEGEDEGQDEGLETVSIEISGLSLYTRHGVSAAEREIGQRLLIDLRLDVGETDATVTDRIQDTVDYAEVCQLVALVAQQRSYKTLERLCSAIADRLLCDFEIEGVWVKASKPEPPIPFPVDDVSVEVWREAAE
jgi:7,8-dihydroneopterin aldolase/epimerase/oxygenase